MILLSVALLFSWAGGGGLPVTAIHTPYTDAADLLLDGLLSCAEVIDLSDGALPASELGMVYADLLHDHPELFHVALRLSYTSREAVADGERVRMVAEVYPAYTLTGKDLTAARGFYRDTVEGLLSEMEAAFAGRPRTETETVLYLHDLLADRYTYDTRTDSPNADAYTFFRDGAGICQAYALAFLALCRGAGLEADLVVSDAMDHAWNHVRVDGVWYHVDVTRDDPIPAEGGTNRAPQDRVTHDRLLRSDAGMASLGYHSYACAAGHTCTDTRFERDGEAALTDLWNALTVFGEDWVGLDGQGAPVSVDVRADGISVGQAGDMDADGIVTPADLLTIYDPIYPEAWRRWLREALVSPPQGDPDEPA